MDLEVLKKAISAAIKGGIKAMPETEIDDTFGTGLPVEIMHSVKDSTVKNIEYGHLENSLGERGGSWKKEKLSPLDKTGWIQDATADIKRRGTEGVCTGDKFGSESCPPGSKRYNLAKTFKKMAKNRK